MVHHLKMKVEENSNVKILIVDNLCQDFMVTHNFTKFLYAIRLPSCYILHIKEARRTSGKMGYSIFDLVISTWIGVHGSEATVGKLLRALNRLQFIMCKESIEEAVLKADNEDSEGASDEEEANENEENISDQEDVPEEVEEDDEEEVVESCRQDLEGLAASADDTQNESEDLNAAVSYDQEEEQN